MDRALRVAGGTARVRDAGGRIRVDVDVDPHVVGGDHRVAPHPSRFAFVGNHDLHTGDVAELFGGRRVTQQQRRPAVGEEILLLGWRQRPVDADPHRSEAHRTVERHDHHRVVRERARDPVAGTHAERSERVRGMVGEAIDVGVAEPSGARHQELTIGVVGKNPVEDLTDGTWDRDGGRHIARTYRAGARQRTNDREPGIPARRE